MVAYDYFEGNAIAASLHRDYAGVISAVSDALDYAGASPRRLLEPRMRTLQLRRLDALTQLRGGVCAAAAIETLSASCRPGDTAWHQLRRSQFALLIASGEPQQAQAVVKVVTTHRGHRALPAPARETWQLFRALAWLSAGPEDADADELAKFLKQDSSFGGDFVRLCCWRTLLQAALKRRIHRYSDISEEVGKLRELSVRNLDAKRDVRFIAFAHVLYRLERRDFDGHLDRVGQRYCNTLLSLPFSPDTSAQNFAPVDVRTLLPYFGLEEIAEVE